MGSTSTAGRAGLKDRQIILRAPVKTRGTTGGPEVTYPVDTYTGIWANVTPARGSERFRGQRDISIDDQVFEIYYLEDVDVEWQIGYNGKNYDIKIPPQEIGRKQGIEFLGRLAQ